MYVGYRGRLGDTAGRVSHGVLLGRASDSFAEERMSRRTRMVIGDSGMRDGSNRARNVTLTGRVLAVIQSQPANTRVKNERDSTPVRSWLSTAQTCVFVGLFNATF